MKTACFLIKIDLPDAATPHNQPDVQAGVIQYIMQHRASYLYGGGGAVVSVFPVPCAFNQPGALCQHTAAEMEAP